MFNATVRTLLISFIFLLIASQTSPAQSTAFTYQGKLNDNGNLANGNYDLQFKLFDAASIGNQIGTTLTFDGNAGNQPFVVVANGIFTVQLDFGACPTCFNGAARFLEIAVKVHGGGVFPAPLSPRQAITSTPYAVKSLNATTADGLSVACVNCVTSSQIASVNGSAVTGTIPVTGVPAGSSNYIQNTTSQQASSNFNISGDGTAGGTLKASIVSATNQFNFSTVRVIGAPGLDNIFVGINAGLSQTGGQDDAFFGKNAGKNNTNENDNTFIGSSAGESNGVSDTTSTGNSNTFVGSHAGFENTIGTSNSFFGVHAGFINFTGSRNTFIGASADFSQGGGGDWRQQYSDRL
jgi:hypothetical protein